MSLGVAPGEESFRCHSFPGGTCGYHVPKPREGPAEPLAPTRDQQKARTLGLTSATALVIGSIIGTGVFTMPAVLAGAGTSSLLVLGVIAIGAMLLAVMFGQLTRRVPNSDGGLYAYSRHEFGDFAGYLTAWCYWIRPGPATPPSWRPGSSTWKRCSASPPVGLDQLGHRPDRACGFRLPSTWLGVRQMAWFQNATVVLKFLPCCWSA